jgi:hypothetical protein
VTHFEAYFTVHCVYFPSCFHILSYFELDAKLGPIGHPFS